MPGAQYSIQDRKSTRLNSSHPSISYAVFCLKKKKTHHPGTGDDRAHPVRLLTRNLFFPFLLHVSLRRCSGIPACVRVAGLISGIFFFNDPATTEIYTLSLHDALPIQTPGKGQIRALLTVAGNPVVSTPNSGRLDRKSTRLNSSHPSISYAVFCLKKKTMFDANTIYKKKYKKKKRT